MSGERQGPEDDKAVAPDARPAEYAPAGKSGDDPLTRNLKRVYADVAAEPVPDHLLALLKQLDGGKLSDDEKSKDDQ